MFYHMSLAEKQKYEYNGNVFEIVVSQAKEDGHLRGYISSGAYSGRIAKMSGVAVKNLKEILRSDPVAILVRTIKEEINAGKFPLPDYLQKKVTERDCF